MSIRIDHALTSSRSIVMSSNGDTVASISGITVVSDWVLIGYILLLAHNTTLQKSVPLWDSITTNSEKGFTEESSPDVECQEQKTRHVNMMH